MELEIRRHSPSQPWTYADLDRHQRQIAERVRAGGEGALLLSEVAPVITFGRRAGLAELTLPEESLRRLGVELLPTGRGGLATWHGPGQWVLFAVDRLDRLTGDSKGVRKAVCVLLAAAADVARGQGVEAELREGAELGVWSSRGKLAAVGVQVSGRVLLHGLSLNARPSPQAFVGLRPCGLDAPVDWLLPAAAPDEQMDLLGKSLVVAVEKHFASANCPGA
ncbi:MAG: hypothetical protein IT285_04180 [Bdellovibrionales bacterium]|nr:hypothetical protein [Bdellovibrionales bacterium]